MLFTSRARCPNGSSDRRVTDSASAPLELAAPSRCWLAAIVAREPRDEPLLKLGLPVPLFLIFDGLRERDAKRLAEPPRDALDDLVDDALLSATVSFAKMGMATNMRQPSSDGER